MSLCVEEQKELAYHVESLHIPLVVRVPQFGNHCPSGIHSLTQFASWGLTSNPTPEKCAVSTPE